MTLKLEYREVQAVETHLVTFTGLMRNGFDSRPKGLPEGSSSTSTSGACDIVFIMSPFAHSLSLFSFPPVDFLLSSRRRRRRRRRRLLLRGSLFCSEAQKGRHGTCIM